ncbi:hypothetical protein [Streptomyces violascens]|uniref:hypothetical protein n=1 Tax=Streptomyces violascens TaxID=67381 RepID=UPI00365FE961
MSADQHENPDAMLRQSAFPADIDLDEGQSPTRSDVSGTAVWAVVDRMKRPVYSGDAASSQRAVEVEGGADQ